MAPEPNPSRRDRLMASRGLIDRKLRFQIRIFLALFAVMAVLAIYRMITGRINPLWAIGAFAAGTLFGVVLTRAKVLRWDSERSQVVASSDVLGGAILILYIVFVFFRNRIVGHWVGDKHIVAVIGFAATDGAMFGRVVFTMRGIRATLRAAGLPVSSSE